MRKKLILVMLSVMVVFPNMVYADNLNQIQLDVQNNESDYSEGSVGSNLLSITSATISFPEIEGYYPEPGEAYVIQKAQIRTSASVNSSSKGILDIGTKVNITGYEGDWAKTENGYIYAGLLSDKFTYKANIHGKNMNSLRYAGYLYKAICELDEPLRSVAENISITLVDSQKDLSNEAIELEDKTVGYTVHYNGTNKSEIRIWANTGSMKKDIIHELGHAFDYSVDGSKGFIYSDADEWKQIYEKEKATYTAKMSGSEHSTSNQREYFADCIEKYIVNHDELKEVCPESFAYIEDILNKSIE